MYILYVVYFWTWTGWRGFVWTIGFCAGEWSDNSFIFRSCFDYLCYQNENIVILQLGCYSAFWYDCKLESKKEWLVVKISPLRSKQVCLVFRLNISHSRNTMVTRSNYTTWVSFCRDSLQASCLAAPRKRDRITEQAISKLAERRSAIRSLTIGE